MANEIKASFDHLTEKLDSMNSWIQSVSIDAVVYRLPILTDRAVPDLIPSHKIKGMDAVAAAMSAYSQMKYTAEQSPGTAFRLPGIVFVDSGEMHHIDDVNKLKNDLQTMIKSAAPEKHKRLKLCRTLFPGYSMSQVYRNIVRLDGEIQSIRFTWMTHSVGGKRLTPDEACQLIKMNISQEDEIGNAARVTALSIALEQVSAYDQSAIVVQRRPVPPHPRANVVSVAGAKQEKANLPFIVNCSPNSISESALKDFDFVNKRPQRSDKLNIDPIHEGLGLYFVETPTDPIVN